MRRIVRRLLALTLILAGAGQARAGLTLTQVAKNEGFGLTTFGDGFPSSGQLNGSGGPIGIAFLPGGKVMVSDFPGNVRVFPTDTDGQHAPSVPPAQNYGGNEAMGLAISGGRIYMTQEFAGHVVQINADGTFNQNVVDVARPLGIVTNPLNGHLFVSSENGPIYDVDPVKKSVTVFVNSSRPDGLTISQDGSILYAAATTAGDGGHILGYRTSDGHQVFDSGPIGGSFESLDGTALGSGTLAGNIFANTNDGRLIEVNLANPSQMTLIASGGSRGDFVGIDPNGTLLVTQTDLIDRLIAPQGGGFGGSVPEPAGWVLLAIGGLGLLGCTRRRIAGRASRGHCGSRPGSAGRDA